MNLQMIMKPGPIVTNTHVVHCYPLGKETYRRYLV